VSAAAQADQLPVRLCHQLHRHHVIAVREVAFPHDQVRGPPIQRVQYKVAGSAGEPVGTVDVLAQEYVRALVHASSVPIMPIERLLISALLPE
jgi:hypothetical protein